MNNSHRLTDLHSLNSLISSIRVLCSLMIQTLVYNAILFTGQELISSDTDRFFFKAHEIGIIDIFMLLKVENEEELLTVTSLFG